MFLGILEKNALGECCKYTLKYNLCNLSYPLCCSVKVFLSWMMITWLLFQWLIFINNEKTIHDYFNKWEQGNIVFCIYFIYLFIFSIYLIVMKFLYCLFFTQSCVIDICHKATTFICQLYVWSFFIVSTCNAVHL